jgi:pimeloyl-ACP methyl ester carboxylesterase
MVTSPIVPRRLLVDGLSIRFAESELRDRHAVLLSPWPESLYAFEPAWADLASEVHLVALDLPGFGHSDGRRDLFAPRAMGTFLIRILDALNLDRVHAVGPDIGTSAVLFAASARPDRFHSLVVGSGAAAYPLDLGEPLTGWITTDIAEFEDQDPRRIVAATIARINPSYATPDHVRVDYLAAYDGRRFVDSMRYVRSLPRELAELRQVLPGIRTPVQIITGTRDSAVPPANARYLQRLLPHCRLDLLDVGHFVWEQNPAAFTALIIRWWRHPSP